MLEHDYIEGTCMNMCPSKEMRMREREGLLHPYEIKQDGGYANNKTHRNSKKILKADPTKVVKSFSRSSAGQECPQPSDVRPFPVLLQTVKYLLKDIMSLVEDYNKLLFVYDFVFDRLRAVRQDMVIQNLAPGQCITILEPIVRFHVYFGYLLCEENINNYDSHINKSHLDECLKRLLVCYEDSKSQTETRVEMESLYLLVSIGDVQVLERGYCLSKDIANKSAIFSTCLNLSLSYYLGNYYKTLTLIKQLEPLHLGVIVNHLQLIRLNVFTKLSIAFSSPNCKYPISQLMSLLLYDNYKDILEDCNYYNVNVCEYFACFTKKNLQYDKTVKLPKKVNFIDVKISLVNIKRHIFPYNV